MRARRIIRIVVICYAVFCAILAVFLGELVFRPQRVRVTKRQLAEATAARFGARASSWTTRTKLRSMNLISRS